MVTDNAEVGLGVRWVVDILDVLDREVDLETCVRILLDELHRLVSSVHNYLCSR